MKKQYLWIVLLVPSLFTMGVLSSNNYATAQETKQPQAPVQLPIKKAGEDFSDIENKIREIAGNNTVYATIIDTTNNSTTSVIGLQQYLNKHNEISNAAEAAAPAKALCLITDYWVDQFGNVWVTETWVIC